MQSACPGSSSADGLMQGVNALSFVELNMIIKR